MFGCMLNIWGLWWGSKLIPQILFILQLLPESITNFSSPPTNWSSSSCLIPLQAVLNHDKSCHELKCPMRRIHPHFDLQKHGLISGCYSDIEIMLECVIIMTRQAWKDDLIMYGTRICRSSNPRISISR